MRRMVYVARTYNISIRNPEAERPNVRPKYTLGDNIEEDAEDISCEVVDFVNLSG
jgi:hypothetical protein